MCDLDPARPSESRRGLDASRRQAARRLRSRASQSQCTSLHIARRPARDRESPDPLSRELAAAPRVLGEQRERARCSRAPLRRTLARLRTPAGELAYEGCP